MFEIGWSELLVIGVVALIAIGPKELPGVLRAVGHWMGKVRRMAAEFQGQFQEAMREAELSDLKKQVDEMTTAAQNVTNYDPLESVRKEVESVTGDLAGAPDAKPPKPPEPADTTPAVEPTATVPAIEPTAPATAIEPPALEPAPVAPAEPAKPAAERP